MDENDVIKKLSEAKLGEILMPARKAALKTALINAAVTIKVPSYAWLKKLIPVFLAVMAVAGTTVYVVDNFDNGSRFNKHGGIWSTYSDAQEGGNSAVWPAAPGRDNDEGFVMSQPGSFGTGYAARVTGYTGAALGLNYNYLGVLVRFDALSSCPTCKGSDIKKYSGIKFSVKGSLEGGRLSFILPYESSECVPARKTCKSMTDYADYEADISDRVTPEWTTVTINFREDLKQPQWAPKGDIFPVEEVLGSVRLFKWQYKNGNGRVMALWIDDLVLC
jgi:hypothetical protein